MKRALALPAVVTVLLSLAAPASAAPTFTSSVERVSAQDLSGSWREGCPVAPAQLRRVRLSHWGFDGVEKTGRLVVHVDQVPAVLGVFSRLFDARFPIERMVPVDAYGGDDDASMADNNTSAFNCRTVAGTSSWSNHAYGWAVDINPVQNPYVRGSTVSPPAGRAYLDRRNRRPGMIVDGDAVVSAFSAAGWTWGGWWSSPKDYQHFEAAQPALARPAPQVVAAPGGSLHQVRRGPQDSVQHRRSTAAGGWTSWADVGGVVAGDPAVASWSASRLDVVAVGGDGALWHRASNDAGRSWGPWTRLGGAFTSSPSAVSWGPGRVDVVARGADGAVWRTALSDGRWLGWQSLDGRAMSNPEISSWGAGRLDVFVRGTDGALYHRPHDGGWGGWRALGGSLASDPAAVSWGPGRIDVVVRGGDNGLWQLTWDGRGWRGWYGLGGRLVAAPDLASRGAGRLDAFVPGTDGRTWRSSWNGSSWSGFSRLPA
jgi:hypothetical protein